MRSLIIHEAAGPALLCHRRITQQLPAVTGDLTGRTGHGEVTAPPVVQGNKHKLSDGDFQARFSDLPEKQVQVGVRALSTARPAGTAL